MIFFFFPRDSACDLVDVCITITKRMTILIIIVDNNNHNNNNNKISIIIILIIINSVIFNIGLFTRTRYTSRRAKDRSITLSPSPT